MKEEMTRYIIDFGFGVATLYTPSKHWAERFKALGPTCYTVEIGTLRLLSEKGGFKPTMWDEHERIEVNGNVYIWRVDGARRMLHPIPDFDWDERWCKTCAYEEEHN